jgi:hypothetical protein
VLFSCEQPTDAEKEVIEEPENFIPIIELLPGSSMIDNGASVTFSVEIDDQDDFYHFYNWTVDGESCGDTESYTFSASPEFETPYIISVAVSDGKDIVSKSAVITVKDRPWQPVQLHIYFFAVGDYPSAENIVRDITADDNSDYDFKMIAVNTSLELYNRDNDPDCYVLGGGYE